MGTQEPMRRATDVEPTPQQFLEECLYTPVHFPGKTVRLERDSLLDQRQRSTSAQVSVAELYHENSKLFPQALPELRASRLDTADLRREYLVRGARAAGGAPLVEVPADLGRLLSALAAATEPTLFYAVELRAVVAGVVVRFDPLQDALRLVRHLGPAQTAALRAALRLVDAAAGDGDSILFVVASFARNEILFGRRGYRRTLLEAGRVTERVVTEAARLGLHARLHYEFLDRDVDGVLMADGVEEGTLTAIEIGGPR